MPNDAPLRTKPDGRSRPHDLARTRSEILAAALTVFAEKGFAGARVDEIAALTHTTKPTIYYHFGSKEALYAAVLEEAFGGIRDMERALELDPADPVGAMRRLVEATFDYHAANPAWVRLVSNENIHHARHIAGNPAFMQRNAPVLATLGTLLEAGQQAGVFRGGIDPFQLHWIISSLSFYRVSNRYTWQVNFGMDMAAPEHAGAQCRVAVDTVLRYLAAGGDQ